MQEDLRKPLLLRKLMGGSIHLLSWDQARKSFNLQLFGADGELTGSAFSLSKGDKRRMRRNFYLTLI